MTQTLSMEEPAKLARQKSAPSVRPSACAENCRFFIEEHCTGKAGHNNVGVTQRFARGATIYSKGDTAHFSYKVIEGAVRLSRILMDGHRQVLNFFLPGETFGIEQSDQYVASAEAVGEVVLLRCPRACLSQISDEQPDMRRRMMAMLSLGMSSAQDHIVMLGHQTAKERVASFLLRLAEHAGAANNQPINIPVGRQDMADYLGLTIETTCRALTDLKSQRLIAIPNRRQIDIRNLAGLRAVAQGDS